MGEKKGGSGGGEAEKENLDVYSHTYVKYAGSNWLYKNGEWIDSHDTIIRLNADPIEPSGAMQRRGFASFPVGNRTSLRYLRVLQSITEMPQIFRALEGERIKVNSVCIYIYTHTRFFCLFWGPCSTAEFKRLYRRDSERV